MFFECAPCKTAFEEDRRTDKVDEPRGVTAKQEKRQGKEADSYEPEESACRTLENRRIPGRLTPPAYKPAKKSDRVVWRAGITYQPVNSQCKNQYYAGNYQVCRYHTKSAPTIRAMNATRFKRSIRV